MERRMNNYLRYSACLYSILTGIEEAKGSRPPCFVNDKAITGMLQDTNSCLCETNNTYQAYLSTGSGLVCDRSTTVA
jgi:hypothetical protein